MSWRDYADLLESGNAEPGAWGSARQANPNNAHDALVSALHSTDPHATAETILALVAEVERLRAEKETLTTTVRALREACESALSYFRAAWTETGHHPASHYADYVDELAEAIGK